MIKKVMALLAASIVINAQPAMAEVHDSLQDLISAWMGIQEEQNPEWEATWLRYEATQSSFLDPTLYAGRTPTQKAQLMDAAINEMRGQFPERMSEVAQFEQNWSMDLAAVNQGLLKAFGTVPQVELYLAFSMAPAKLAVGDLGGKPSICVNTRRLLPYRSAATRVLLGRYLFGVIVPRWQRSNPPGVADRLHTDGLGLWAVTRISPEIPLTEVLECTNGTLQILEAGRSEGAKKVLAALDSKDPNALKRLFYPSGDPTQPEVGHFISLEVARQIASDVGESKLPRLSHQEYVTRTRQALHTMAGVASNDPGGVTSRPGQP